MRHERRGHIGRNPAQLVRPPRIQHEPVEPFTLEEVQRVLSAATKHRNGARWAIALALGLRQGEALALRGTTSTWRPSHSGSAQHGCGRSTSTAATASAARPPATARNVGRPTAITGATKSAAGNRVVGLPDELVTLLKDHRREQLEERIRAGSLWQEGGWVFTTLLGRPIAPNSDYHEWRALLRARRRTSRSSPRRSAHRSHCAARARRPRTDRHVDHGLVEHLHGRALPARHRSDPPRGRQQRRWVALQ